MKVKIEDNKKLCQKLITIEVETERVKSALDEIYKSIAKDAQVPGFRKGKAPRDILQIHYRDTANDEAVRHLVWEAYRDAIKANNIEPISYPVIEDVKFNNEGPLNFTIKIDVKPVVNLKPYTKIKIKKISDEVAEEDINKSLEAIRESVAKTEADGKKVLPAPPAGGPAMDDELAKQVGNFKNLQELKDRLKEELSLDKKRRQRLDMENQLFDSLLKANQFDVPESSVHAQLQSLLNDAKLRLAYQGHKKEEIESQEDKLKQTLVINAERQVKIFFILEAIANRANINVTDEEIDKQIETMSKMTKQDAQRLKQSMQEKGLIDSLKSQLLHDKVIEFLLEKADIQA